VEPVRDGRLRHVLDQRPSKAAVGKVSSSATGQASTGRRLQPSLTTCHPRQDQGLLRCGRCFVLGERDRACDP
jgi:hypothetical protein